MAAMKRIGKHETIEIHAEKHIKKEREEKYGLRPKSFTELPRRSEQYR